MADRDSQVQIELMQRMLHELQLLKEYAAFEIPRAYATTRRCDVDVHRTYEINFCAEGDEEFPFSSYTWRAQETPGYIPIIHSVTLTADSDPGVAVFSDLIIGFRASRSQPEVLTACPNPNFIMFNEAESVAAGNPPFRTSLLLTNFGSGFVLPTFEGVLNEFFIVSIRNPAAEPPPFVSAQVIWSWRPVLTLR